MRLPFISCVVALLWIAASADAVRAQDAPERALARDILRELMETPTTEADGATPLVSTPFVSEATTLATETPRALVRLEGAVHSVWTR